MPKPPPKPSTETTETIPYGEGEMVSPPCARLSTPHSPPAPRLRSAYGCATPALSTPSLTARPALNLDNTQSDTVQTSS